MHELGSIFPENEEELTALQMGENIFKLAAVKDFGPKVNGRDTYLQHSYEESGIKIIKAIVFNTMDSELPDYTDYRQAVRWKLVTIKINLSEDSMFSSDFDDVGGLSFTFLPYPDQIIYNGESKSCELYDGTGEKLPCPEYISEVTGNYYKSSHPIVGGLSRDSNYVKDLEKMEQLSPSLFGKAEGSQLRALKKAVNNTPGKPVDEYGAYTGNIDLSKFMYFAGEKDYKYTCTTSDTDGDSLYSGDGYCAGLTNTDEITLLRPLDMYDFLNINPEVEPNNFMYYNNFGYWNGIDNGFPMESSITDIFIDDTKSLSEYCILEFNCWNVEGGSILDTSGVGNKGILIGDYAVKKPGIGSPAKRDSALVKPVIESSNGAF